MNVTRHPYYSLLNPYRLLISLYEISTDSSEWPEKPEITDLSKSQHCFVRHREMWYALPREVDRSAMVSGLAAVAPPLLPAGARIRCHRFQ